MVGIFSRRSCIEYDVMLATPALLLSKLSCSTHLSRSQEILAQADDGRGKEDQAAESSDDSLKTDVFGCLHIILRDCANSEAECHSLIFDDELHDILARLS